MGPETEEPKTIDNTKTAEYAEEKATSAAEDTVGKTENEELKENFVENTHIPKLRIELDVIATVLLIFTLFTRLYRLDLPKNIVFDELHYGRYVSLYIKGIFFFDSHPPLGKQLIALMAYLFGYDGKFSFDKIGTAYDDTVPIVALRLLPAICGSVLVLVSYHIFLRLRLSHCTASLAALLLIFENALLTQSRFVLLESFLLLFALFGILCIINFIRSQESDSPLKGVLWLVAAFVSFGFSLSVKYSGVYAYFLGVMIVGRQFWNIVKNKKIPITILLIKLAWRVFIIVAIPLAVYVAHFYIHLSLLTKAGPHDSVMTSAFQASLEGGLASIVKGQPLLVAHGSQVTLRHTHGRMCWLHSHSHVYPVKYADSRGSSHQQQITCYSFKDVNNWWIVKRPDKNDLIVETPIDAIKHGDVVQLVHGITSRALNSHDVAAPMSPQSQEVSCYIDYNVSMPAQNLWRVEILNRDNDETVWHTIQSMVHLIHVSTGMALKFSGKQLPDWGFNQHEIVADKTVNHDDTVWNVEEHRYTKTDDKKERERQLVTAEMIPTKATHLSFWEKFLELQYKMLFASQDYVQNHMFSSEPLEWPFLTRGIAYWVSKDSNAQVHLIGNIITWLSGSFGLLVYFNFLLFYLIRRRRNIYDLNNVQWQRFVDIGFIFGGGYLMHYLPYFFMERTLFLHHYIPAYVFKIFLLAYAIEHVYYVIRTNLKLRMLSNVFILSVIVWLAYVVLVYYEFSVLSYGNKDMTEDELLRLRWKDTWDFIFHKK